MEFHETGLPDRSIFHTSFAAGWERYEDQPDGDAQYAQGPLAMARLILQYGGDCHHLAAAACCAGPALFTQKPDSRLDPRLLGLGREILAAEDGKNVPELSPDARLFLQASAIMMLETLAVEKRAGDSTLRASFNEAVILYSAARGRRDVYDLDARFETVAGQVDPAAFPFLRRG